jgi:hypothetical protein
LSGAEPSRVRILDGMGTPIRASGSAVILATVGSEQVKKITLIANNFDVVQARRHIAGCAIGRDLRIVSFEEERGRLSTKVHVTVAGHPRRVREFHSDVRGSGSFDPFQGAGTSGDLLGDLVLGVVVAGMAAGAKTGWRKWQERRDPPSGTEDASTPIQARTVVYWKWEEGGSGGEPLGPVWVDRYAAGETEPESSEEWSGWARRADALAYAREHGYVFFPDE